jgi:hypothetical protein
MTAVYIAKYLKKLFLDFNDNKNGVVDLFIETYFNYHDFRSSGQISNITNEFINCVNNIDINERKKCFNEYKNLRYHYGDIRSSCLNLNLSDEELTQIGPIKLLCYYLFNNSRHPNGIFIPLTMMINAYESKCLSKDKEKDVDSYLEQCINNITLGDRKIYKNYKKCSMIIRQHIKRFFKVVLRELLEQYKEILKILTRQSYIDRSMYEVAKLISVFFGTIFMDIYLLSRAFKKFDKEITSGNSSNNIHQDYADKIIIIAGDAHINTYIKFLNEIGYETKYDKNIDKSAQTCVDITGIPSLKGGAMKEIDYNPLSFSNYNGDIKDVNCIGGPIHISVLSNTINIEGDIKRTFYLIGDRHTTDKVFNCIKPQIIIPTLSEFIKILHTKLNKLIYKCENQINFDIFVEMLKIVNIFKLYYDQPYTGTIYNSPYYYSGDWHRYFCYIKEETSKLINNKEAIRKQEEYRLQHNTSKTFEEQICENKMLL